MIKLFQRKSKHPRWVPSDGGFYTSVRATKMPTPGAMEYGFLPERLAQHPLIGPAIGYAFRWNNFEPQNVQTASITVNTGLGGLAQGQIVGQPLSDPYNGA